MPGPLIPRKTPSTGFSLKEHLFSRERVEYLAGLLGQSTSDFDQAAFVKQTLSGWSSLELKQRIVQIACVLEQHLADHFPTAAQQIVAALPPPLDDQLSDDDFGDFIFAPLGEYIVRRGQQRRHVKISLQTLKQLTMRFSMEDAIRHFIRAHPEQTVASLEQWSTDPNYHVRRLVSEGTRPLLPWSGRIDLPLSIRLPWLDRLHADSTRYVTRSVANHLNDISKSQPQQVLDALSRWREWRRQNDGELRWLERHALRTLIKRGDASTLRWLGFRTQPAIDLDDLALTATTVSPGDTLEFSCTLTARRRELLVIDYVIDFVKANGRTAPKVFKLKQVELAAGQQLRLSKRHPLRAAASTFTLYPGGHRLTLQINGQPLGSLEFELV